MFKKTSPWNILLSTRRNMIFFSGHNRRPPYNLWMIGHNRRPGSPNVSMALVLKKGIYDHLIPISDFPSFYWLIIQELNVYFSRRCLFTPEVQIRVVNEIFQQLPTRTKIDKIKSCFHTLQEAENNEELYRLFAYYEKTFIFDLIKWKDIIWKRK